MRINKFIARATGLSRRSADHAIQQGRVAVNNQPAALGDDVAYNDTVTLDGHLVDFAAKDLTVMLNKPVGYVCSRQGQGSRTIYDLLPIEYHELKTIGRLDKDSSGLILLTNKGDLADRLTHPRYAKAKIYEITLDKPLAETDKNKIEQGVAVDDYISRLQLSVINNHRRGAGPKPPVTTGNRSWRITMSQGRNRQIRRTFAVLGYRVKSLHRIQFGDYHLVNLQPGRYQELPGPSTIER